MSTANEWTPERCVRGCVRGGSLGAWRGCPATSLVERARACSHTPTPLYSTPLHSTLHATPLPSTPFVCRRLHSSPLHSTPLHSTPLRAPPNGACCRTLSVPLCCVYVRCAKAWERVLASHGAVVRERLTFEDYAWALAIIDSRSFQLSAPSSHWYSMRYVRTAGSVVGGGATGVYVCALRTVHGRDHCPRCRCHQ